MKSVFKILIAAVLLTACLTACSNIPDEPAETSVKKYTYVDPYGQTAPVAENIEDYPGMTQPLYYVETKHEIESVESSYYVYKNTVAEIEDIDFSYEGSGFSLDIIGRADIKITAKGFKNKEMRIGYTSYDENGKKLDVSSIVFSIEDMDEGEIKKNTLVLVPRDAVKVVFHDYEE